MAATTVTLHHHPLSFQFHQHITKCRLPINSFTHSQKLDHSWSSNIVQQNRQSIRGLPNWGAVNTRNGVSMGDYYGDDDDEEDEDEEEEEEDRSLDLLVRFVENVFKKVSRKARKAVKSVLPVPISAKLVGFAVNGTIVLAFLWILKAFLEVICTLGSVIFTSILLIRGVWTGISYFQESCNFRLDDEGPQGWSATRPAI